MEIMSGSVIVQTFPPIKIYIDNILKPFKSHCLPLGSIDIIILWHLSYLATIHIRMKPVMEKQTYPVTHRTAAGTGLIYVRLLAVGIPVRTWFEARKDYSTGGLLISLSTLTRNSIFVPRAYCIPCSIPLETKTLLRHLINWHLRKCLPTVRWYSHAFCPCLYRAFLPLLPIHR